MSTLRSCSEASQLAGMSFMRLLLQRIFAALVLLLVASYICDYVTVRYRMSKNNAGDPFDVVTYPRLLAIPQKGNRVEYTLDAVSPTESDSCVHSLFPHFGYTPCWYINRKAHIPIAM